MNTSPSTPTAGELWNKPLGITKITDDNRYGTNKAEALRKRVHDFINRTRPCADLSVFRFRVGSRLKCVGVNGHFRVVACNPRMDFYLLRHWKNKYEYPYCREEVHKNFRLIEKKLAPGM